MFAKIKNKFDQLCAYMDSDVFTGRQILGIYLPLAGEQLFFALVSMVSTGFIAGEGEAALAAVNMINVSNQMFQQICVSFGVGATVVVSQYTGARNPALATRTQQQAMSIALTVGILLTTVLYLIREYSVGFFLGGAPADVTELALIYFVGVIFSFPFLAFNQAFIGSMRGRGRTKVSLMMSMTINLSEIGFCYVFIVLMKMGVAGLAASLVAARFTASVLASIYLIIHRHDLGLKLANFFILSFSILRGLILVSVPVALESIFFSSGKALTQRFITGYGTAHMAANAFQQVVQSFTIGPTGALGQATMAISGMCLGRERVDLSREYAKKFLRLALALSALIVIPAVPMTFLLIRLYGITGEARTISLICVGLIFAGTPAFMGRSSIMSSVLRSGGDATYTSMASLASMWCFRVVIAYVCTTYIRWGAPGIILAMVLEWGARGTFFTLRFRTEKWYQHKVIVR